MYKIGTVAALVAMLSAPVHASWGNLVEDVKKTGGELIQQQLQADQQLDETTLGKGLREMLQLGSERAVQQLSQPEAFLDNDQLRIGLPDSLSQALPLLQTAGLDNPLGQSENMLNTVASQALPQLLPSLTSIIGQLNFSDARQIYSGLGDAATRYLQQQSGGELLAALTPIVSQLLTQNDLVKTLTQLPDSNLSTGQLTDYVANQTLNGLFDMMATEEKQIRENPVSRTSELLKQLW